MTPELSLSTFTIEADRVPLFAVQGKKQSDAEVFLVDKTLKDQLRLLRSASRPLCDDFSIFRIRLASQNEKALFYENAASLLAGNGQLAVLLIKPDEF